MVRSVLAALDTLSEASLGAVRFRWQASPLAYDPVAGLAEDPSGRCDRLLKSLVDRFLETVAEPTAPKLPPQPAKRDPVRSVAAGVASTVGLRGRSPVRKSDRAAARVDTPVAALRSEALEVDDTAVVHILGRHDSRSAPGENAGGAMNSAALKKRSSVALSASATPGPANSGSPATRDFVEVSYRRHHGVTHSAARHDDTKERVLAHFDAHVGGASARARDSGAAGHVSRRGSMHSAAAPKGGRFAYRRALDSDGNSHAVLGKSAMSRSGLSVPIALEHAVSADRLSAWADPAMRVDAPRRRVRSPKPAAAEPAVLRRESANGKMRRPNEGIDDDHSRFQGTDILGPSSSTLGRLVHQWHEDNKGSSRSESLRELTRPHVRSSSLSDGPPSPDLSTSTASDTDFARRLENVLLRESRRHGIVVEDQ